VHTTREHSDRCEAVLGRVVRPGETVVARGRADFVRALRDIPVGSGYTFLFVTSERVIWTDYLRPDRVFDLQFDLLTSFSDAPYQHRCVIRLRHRPVDRVEWAPRWRILWWSWGNAEVARPRIETMFEFSRATTEAANALRSELARRRIPHAGPLTLPRRRDGEVQGVSLAHPEGLRSDVDD
jgi:hypothetical protein